MTQRPEAKRRETTNDAHALTHLPRPRRLGSRSHGHAVSLRSVFIVIIDVGVRSRRHGSKTPNRRVAPPPAGVIVVLKTSAVSPMVSCFEHAGANTPGAFVIELPSSAVLGSLENSMSS